MLLGQPETHLVIAGKAVRVLEFFLQGCQGCFGDALAQGRPRDLIPEHLVDPTRGVGLKLRRDTRAMGAEEVCLGDGGLTRSLPDRALASAGASSGRSPVACAGARRQYFR